MFAPKKFTVSSFTNPHGEFVHQAMCGGMPITRELEDLARADNAAREAFSQHHGPAILTAWNGDAGIETTLDEKAVV